MPPTAPGLGAPGLGASPYVGVLVASVRCVFGISLLPQSWAGKYTISGFFTAVAAVQATTFSILLSSTPLLGLKPQTIRLVSKLFTRSAPLSGQAT